MIPDKEDKVKERQELECPVTSSVLDILAETESEVESQLDQVRDVAGLWVGRCHG